MEDGSEKKTVWGRLRIASMHRYDLHQFCIYNKFTHTKFHEQQKLPNLPRKKQPASLQTKAVHPSHCRKCHACYANPTALNATPATLQEHVTELCVCVTKLCDNFGVRQCCVTMLYVREYERVVCVCVCACVCENV